MHKDIAAKQVAEADALFMSIGEGAIANDHNGNIVRINKVAAEILGITQEEAIGRWFPGIVISVDKEGEPIKPLDRAITRAVISGKPVSERASYLNSQGKIVPVYVTVSPVLHDGKPVGTVEVFRDISSELEVDRLKSEFISIASHQLRTPATAVKNYVGLLREGYAGKLTPEQADLIEMAYQSNENQLEIVNNLLYAARTDNDEVRLKLAKVNLCELVSRCVADLRSSFEERAQKIDVILPNKDATATIDKQFIAMLTENLLSNASKYTPNGGNIDIRLSAESNGVMLRVSDTGVGIADEDMPKLFRRFSRIDNELSTMRGGSGIGLYLVKRIAELHNGKIDVKSQVGKGSTFSVIIPKEQPYGQSASSRR